MIAEPFIEATSTEEYLSEYKLDRGKPIPDLTHGAIQLNLGFEFKLHYGTQYRIASEVALATASEHYTFFCHDDRLTDKKLSIDIDLTKVFV